MTQNSILNGGFMNYRIVNNNGHYDVYVDGAFYCSADTVAEAVRELNGGY